MIKDGKAERCSLQLLRAGLLNEIGALSVHLADDRLAAQAFEVLLRALQEISNCIGIFDSLVFFKLWMDEEMTNEK